MSLMALAAAADQAAGAIRALAEAARTASPISMTSPGGVSGGIDDRAIADAVRRKQMPEFLREVAREVKARL